MMPSAWAASRASAISIATESSVSNSMGASKKPSMFLLLNASIDRRILALFSSPDMSSLLFSFDNDEDDLYYDPSDGTRWILFCHLLSPFCPADPFFYTTCYRNPSNRVLCQEPLCASRRRTESYPTIEGCAVWRRRSAERFTMRRDRTFPVVHSSTRKGHAMRTKSLVVRGPAMIILLAQLLIVISLFFPYAHYW